jgi:hypothetical protein
MSIRYLILSCSVVGLLAGNASPVKAFPDDEDSGNNRTVINTSEIEKDNPTIMKFLDSAQENEHFKELLKDINNRYPVLNVKVSEEFPDKGTLTTISIDGITISGTISLRKDIIDKPEVYEVLVWELCNAGNKHIRRPIHFSRSPDEYAFFSEAAEHKSLVRRTEILIEYFNKNRENKNLIEILNQHLESNVLGKVAFNFKKLFSGEEELSIIDLCISRLKNDRKTFKDYWEKLNEFSFFSSKHSDTYRQYFYNLRPRFDLLDINSLSDLDKELIKYAFSQWTDKERISEVSEEIREYYRAVLSDTQSN